jgi:hypothetical protein
MAVMSNEQHRSCALSDDSSGDLIGDIRETVDEKAHVECKNFLQR